MCITSCCLTNIFKAIKRFLLNVYLQALLKTLILERPVRWGMQHEIGFSQWDGIPDPSLVAQLVDPLRVAPESRMLALLH